MTSLDKQKFLKKIELKEFPEPPVVRLRYPVLLCHGYGAVASLMKPTPLYEPCMFLRKHGVMAFSPNIVPYATIETRSKQWVKRIETLIDTYQFDKFNIVAHSMGGLDLRHALVHTDIRRHISSVTTIATPHRGTYLADYILSTPEKVRSKLGDFFNWFGENIYPDSKNDSIGSIRQLTRTYVQNTFNPEHPDLEGLPYFSYSAAVGKGTDSPLNPVYRYQNSLIAEHEGLNDSFVSVESAKWGEHIETISISHMEQLFVQTGKSRKAVVENFWLTLARMLAGKGL